MNAAIFMCVNSLPQEQIYGVCDIEQYADGAFGTAHAFFCQGKDEQQHAAGKEQQAVEDGFGQNRERRDGCGHAENK